MWVHVMVPMTFTATAESSHQTAGRHTQTRYMSVKARCYRYLPPNQGLIVTNEMWASVYADAPDHWIEAGQHYMEGASSPLRRWFYGHGDSYGIWAYFYGSWANNTNYAGLAIVNDPHYRNQWSFYYGSTLYGSLGLGSDSNGPMPVSGYFGWQAGAETSSNSAQTSFYDTNLGFYRFGVRYTSWYVGYAPHNEPPFTPNAQFGANWLADYNPAVVGAGGC